MEPRSCQVVKQILRGGGRIVPPIPDRLSFYLSYYRGAGRLPQTPHGP